MVAAMKTPRANSYNLLCVAHPDDETIFFGGLLQRKQTRPWTVICMTDGNADGEGKKRRKQFEKACRDLGVANAEWWGYQDAYEKRLPAEEIASRLVALPTPKEVFTHGIIGEYGHPHHQDVSYAVHTAFEDHPKLMACAYNAAPDMSVQLSRKEFETKSRILTEIYGSETQRFLNLLPSTSAESFLKLDRAEVQAVYDYFAHNRPLRQKDLRAYKWLAGFLKTRRHQARPF